MEEVLAEITPSEPAMLRDEVLRLMVIRDAMRGLAPMRATQALRQVPDCPLLRTKATGSRAMDTGMGGQEPACEASAPRLILRPPGAAEKAPGVWRRGWDSNPR